MKERKCSAFLLSRKKITKFAEKNKKRSILKCKLVCKIIRKKRNNGKL